MPPDHRERCLRYVEIAGGILILEAAFEVLRLQHVRWRLLNSSHSLAQLADEIGVGDASHLGKLFRQRFGLAPGTFRRQGGVL